MTDQRLPPTSERREQLIREARRLFAVQGYKATSVRDIASAVGLKAGSLYSHISGKEELLWEIVWRVADEFDSALGDANVPGPPAEQLRAALIAYTEVVARHREDAAVLFGDWRQLSPERQQQIAQRRDAVEGVLRGIIARGVREGDFAPHTNAHLSAVLALSGANWLPNWFQPGGALSAGEVAAAYAELLLRGIEPR